MPDLERLSETVRDIMLLSVPHQYENTKHWGRTKEVWDGLKISLGNQAILLARDLGRAAEALPLAEEALRLANELSMPTEVEHETKVLNFVRSRLK